MILGQSAATAAVLAIDAQDPGAGCALREAARALLQDGQILEATEAKAP